MLLTNQDHIIRISANHYSLTGLTDRPFVLLDDGQGNRLAELLVLSSIHPMHDRDDTTATSAWEAEETPGEIILSMTARSSCWEQKIYRFICKPDRFTYEIEVRGKGRLAEVTPFGGYCSGLLRWGSGFFWSGQGFKQGFNPEPNSDEINHFAPAESSAIDLMGVPLPAKGNWFFTPPPFCFAFEGADGWIGMGVETQPGENRFTEYGYHGRRGAFHLALSYEGHTTVDGSYRLPRIGFDFCGDEYDALRAHVRALKEEALIPNEPPKIKPIWWFEPIFCGWGAQCSLASGEHGKAPGYSQQKNYETFVTALDLCGIWPGIVVIDDKWQKTYGTNEVDKAKWPDIRGFTREQHAHGVKVLLWLKAWDPEGLPADECITNASGVPIAFDPSNPVFEERLRESIRMMLSPEGYGADGFKIDFTARTPSGPGIRLHGDLWGLELMKRYLQIVHSEAKQVKPDALVITHTPHPYLSDVVDMVRLNDINPDKDVNQAMTLRAKVARIACPEAIIDTDNWPVPDRATWRKYLSIQADLGVPSLYYAGCFDAGKETFTAEDYRLIREVWSIHRARKVT